MPEKVNEFPVADKIEFVADQTDHSDVDKNDVAQETTEEKTEDKK